MEKQQHFDFYNTINDPPDQLIIDKKNANSQQSKIYTFFRRNYPMAFTPFDVQYLVFEKDKQPPVTSVRRAITNLTKMGYLVKTEKKKSEVYGKDNYKWKYNEQKSTGNSGSDSE